MSLLLEVRQVVAGYGETVVLHEVSIQLEAGEFVTIIGPNGSGKSTLLKTIFGLLRPKKGSVHFDGQDITGSPPERLVRRGLSYEPHSNNDFPSLTVGENLEMGAFIRKDSVTPRLERMYQLFPDLSSIRSQKAGNLSGGQKQMLAFGRAMMLDPKLLLLDEPSAGLAPAAMDAIFEKIVEIHQSGVSVIIVEQNARKALMLSQRGYVLANGENRLEEEAHQLLSNPEVARLYLGG